MSAALLGAVGLSGCFGGSEGVTPPTDSFYFPTGLVVSPGGKALYVANSDFDLQYNGGTVQVLDLEAVRDRARTVQAALAQGKAASDACADAGLAPNDTQVLHPGPCGPLPAADFIEASASIGAFASGAVLLHNPDASGARLFVPVRGDPSITYFDVSDDRPDFAGGSSCQGRHGKDGPFCLDCGASSDGERCSSSFRIGENPYDNLRGLRLPLEPVGIAGNPAVVPTDFTNSESSPGQAIVVAHQTQAAASLITNPWGSRPTLQHAIPGLAEGPTDLFPVPMPRIIEVAGIAYEPGFLLTFRAAPELDLLRYHSDHLASPSRPFLTRSQAIGITSNASGADSRGVAIDASERQQCEQGCGSDAACLLACAAIPLRFFVANRSPASLLIGRMETELAEEDGALTSAFETLSIDDTVPLAYGASRVAIGHVIGEDGAPHVRVFAVAFDSRFVFSYDPEARRIDAVIRTGRGPHAIAFDIAADGSYSFMYVGHFTDSYIGVVDLDMRSPSTFGSMILTLGQPVPPRDSQ